jgi:tripartite-type tricarboxylate transporter receptor subunit TctC
VVVDNRGGAAGVIGSEIVAKAAPDGYTLLMIAPSHVSNPAFQKLPYDPVKGFSPIAKLGYGPYLLVVHPSVQVNSLKELIALAKQKPNQLKFSTAGVTGINHMAAELLMDQADIKVKTLHYQGGGPALLAVVAGECDAEVSSAATCLPHIQSGKLKAIANAGPKRLPNLPNLPTFQEAGFPDYEIVGFWGILAPPGTPGPIVDRLTKEIKAILATDEAMKVIGDQGSVPDYQDPQGLTKFMENQIKMYTDLAKKGNFQLPQEPAK